jgi:hypothetical protein
VGAKIERKISGRKLNINFPSGISNPTPIMKNISPKAINKESFLKVPVDLYARYRKIRGTEKLTIMNRIDEIRVRVLTTKSTIAIIVVIQLIIEKK